MRDPRTIEELDMIARTVAKQAGCLLESFERPRLMQVVVIVAEVAHPNDAEQRVAWALAGGYMESGLPGVLMPANAAGLREFMVDVAATVAQTEPAS